MRKGRVVGMMEEASVPPTVRAGGGAEGGVGTVEVEVGGGWNGGAAERRTVGIEGAGEAAREGEKETAVVVGVEGQW